MPIVGGDLIGQGTYGCAFTPMVPCADGKRRGIPSKYIGKVFADAENAEEELEYAAILRKIDPQSKMFYYPNDTCDVKVGDVRAQKDASKCELIDRHLLANDTLVQLILPHGGTTLHDFLKVLYPRATLPCADMIHMFERLFYGLKQLTLHKYVHQDIKTPNIVAAQGAIRLIDFGTLVSFRDFYKYEDNFMMQDHNYHVNGPEYRLMSEPTNFSVRSFIANENDLYKQYGGFVAVHRAALQSFATLCNGKTRAERFDLLRSWNAAAKADIFSLGIVIVSVLSHLSENDIPEASSLFAKLLTGMTHPNPKDRMGIDDALRYVRRIKKYSKYTGKVPTKLGSSSIQAKHFQEIFKQSHVSPKAPKSQKSVEELIRHYTKMKLVELHALQAYKNLPRTINKSKLAKAELVAAIAKDVHLKSTLH